MHESPLAPSMAWSLLRDGRAQLIDLRGRDEVELPRIPGARVIPVDELPRELAALDRERPVVLVSSTGRRAAEATEVLRSAGITASAIAGRYARLARRRIADRDRRTPAPPRET